MCFRIPASGRPTGAALLALLLLLACAQASALPARAGSPAAPAGGAVAAPVQCGTISTRGPQAPADPAAADQAGGCFWHAYQQCQAATLVYTVMGVDTGDVHTLTITAGARGACTVQDSATFQLFPRPATTTVYNCAGLAVQDGQLVAVSCGAEGDLAIPAHVTAAGTTPSPGTTPVPGTPVSGEGRACGTVAVRGGSPADSAAAQQTESCFAQAFQQCQVATLVLTVQGVDTQARHTFTIVPGGKQCVIQDTEVFTLVPRGPVTTTYTCSGLRAGSSGLTITGCGAAGDIAVPGPALAPNPTPVGQPTPVGTPIPNSAAFAAPAFARVWARTDQPVAGHEAGRSWLWGPAPISGPLQEPYQEGPGGQHLVQYFDKSRMEINNPNGDPSSPFYVTNGLLVEELISGRVQVGNSAYQTRHPAVINVAGDAGDANAPTYATFGAVANTVLGDHRATDRTGAHPTAVLARDGTVTTDSSHASDAGTALVHFEAATGHNIPGVFWDFLNASGPVLENGLPAQAPLIRPWFYASGLPISEPYWATVQVRGTPTPVLIQAFERRVLTYTPSNAAAFQVEMGNVGQHYYTWRYGTSTP